jgi:hypothetical protein
LGTGTVATKLRRYRTYDEAVKFVQPLKLKTIWNGWHIVRASGKIFRRSRTICRLTLRIIMARNFVTIIRPAETPELGELRLRLEYELAAMGEKKNVLILRPADHVGGDDGLAGAGRRDDQRRAILTMTFSTISCWNGRS